LAEADGAASVETTAAVVTTTEAAAAAAAGSATPKTPSTAAQPGHAGTGVQHTAATQARNAEAALKSPLEGARAHEPTILQQARDAKLPMDTEDWELSKEGLPEGSTLSGSKALMEEYPDDEANSKKVKKPNNGKEKKTKTKA
jgi:hypothetical protein